MIDSTTRRDAVGAYVRFTLNYVRDLNARGGGDQWERLAVGPVQVEGESVVGFLGLQSTTHADRQALLKFSFDAVDRSWNSTPLSVKQIRVATKLQVPDTLKKTVSSSNVDAVSYFPGKKVLQIKFKSGKSYQYFDVPRETYDDMITAPSKGQFFWDHIRRKGYSYRRVEQMKKRIQNSTVQQWAAELRNKSYIGETLDDYFGNATDFNAVRAALRAGGEFWNFIQGKVVDAEVPQRQVDSVTLAIAKYYLTEVLPEYENPEVGESTRSSRVKNPTVRAVHEFRTQHATETVGLIRIMR